MVLFGIGVTTGTMFISVTTIVTFCTALRMGTPLSDTRTVMTFVLGDCVSVGVQVKTPLLELMLAPTGAMPSSVKRSRCTGTSGSNAWAVKLIWFPSLPARLAIGVSTGGKFASVTSMVTVTELLIGGEPLSMTRTVKMFVLGPCVSDGVQLNTPLSGLMAAPTGTLPART